MVLTTLQPLAYAVAYVSFFFGIVSTILRFYSRHYILKTIGWDDYIAMGVLALVIGQQVVLHMFLYWGCGLHMDQLAPNQVLEILKWLFIEEVFYYTVHWAIKTAFLLFYLRMSPNKTFRMFVHIGMGLNASIWFINICIACFQCIPFDEILHPGTHPGAVCISRLVLLIVPSILNIFEDFYILLLPISTIWNLQMSLRRKIGVLSVIAFGSSSVIIACFRLMPLFELNTSTDVSWVLGKMVIVAALEIQFAVIAVNLPSLKALWMRYANGSTSGSGPDNSKQKGYKLSSVGQKGGNSIGSRWRSGGKNKGSRGSITMMELGITSTESEEELFRQGGAPLQDPVQAKDVAAGEIKVTREVDVNTSTDQKHNTPPAYFFRGN